MLIFIKNLWALGRNLPSVVAALRVLFDFIGAAQTKKFLQRIVDAVKEITGNAVADDEAALDPAARQRRRRLRWDQACQKAALDILGLTEDQYVAVCRQQGTAGPIIDDEQLA